MEKGAEATTTSAPAASLEQAWRELRVAELQHDDARVAELRRQISILADQARTEEHAKR